MENLLGGAAIRRRSGRVVALGSTAVLAAAGAGPLVMLTSSTASANAALVVSTLADSGAGSLRQAMDDANAAAGVDTITFTSGLTGTIDVLSDLPHLYEGIDLQGPGASVITIDGGWTEAGGDSAGHTLFVFYDIDVVEGASTISGVTITGGNSLDNRDSSGGAIQKFYGDADLTIADVVLTGNVAYNDGGAVSLYDTDGTVTIRDSVISNNVAGDGGGALYSDGDNALYLNLINVEITGNTAGENGGGLYLDSTYATIINSTIDGNVTEDYGGGISVDGGSLTISNTTISGNEGHIGGGIYAMDLYSDLMILNSTISGNHSTNATTVNGGGGGIYLYNNGAVLIQSTVTDNSSDAVTDAVGGIQSSGDPLVANPLVANDVTLIGSIVAGNDGFDIGSFGGSVLVAVEAEYSVLGAIDPLVTFVDGGGTQVGVTDPMLGLLANNGGVTKTHALLAGSPAIDAGPDPVPVFDGNEFDQRGVGFARIVFGVADVGAFEVQEPPTPEPIAPSFTG
jgi:predicted outer membrane repeat protein